MASEKRTCRKYTAEEDAIILNTVMASPQNLSKCFAAIGEQIGRSTGSVSQRWYLHLSNPESRSYAGTASMLMCRNRDIGSNSIPEVGHVSVWKRILKFFGLSK